MADKVLIGIPIPSQQKIPSHLALALRNVRGNFEVKVERDLPGEDFKGDRIYRITKARERIRQYFLSGNYSHLLFIDSDIDFPPETLEVLLSANADVVYHSYLAHAGYPGIGGIIRTGLGCTLIKRKVLEKCDFITGIEEEGNDAKHRGEDFLFKEKVENASFSILVLENRLQLKHLQYDIDYFWKIFANRKQDREAVFGRNCNS
jgi:hypothetical protein